MQVEVKKPNLDSNLVLEFDNSIVKSSTDTWTEMEFDGGGIFVVGNRHHKT